MVIDVSAIVFTFFITDWERVPVCTVYASGKLVICIPTVKIQRRVLLNPDMVIHLINVSAIHSVA